MNVLKRYKAFLSAERVELVICQSGEEKVRSAMLKAMPPLKKNRFYSINNSFTYIIASKYHFYLLLHNITEEKFNQLHAYCFKKLIETFLNH